MRSNSVSRCGEDLPRYRKEKNSLFILTLRGKWKEKRIVDGRVDKQMCVCVCKVLTGSRFYRGLEWGPVRYVSKYEYERTEEQHCTEKIRFPLVNKEQGQH